MNSSKKNIKLNYFFPVSYQKSRENSSSNQYFSEVSTVDENMRDSNSENEKLDQAEELLLTSSWQRSISYKITDGAEKSVFLMGQKNIQIDSDCSKDKSKVNINANANIDKTKYKTEMCKNWAESGFCQYFNKCMFAHGTDELAQKELPSKYRSKPCKFFSKNGYCNYGKRCMFSHETRNLQDFVSFSFYRKLLNFHGFLWEKKRENRKRLPIFAEITNRE